MENLADRPARIALKESVGGFDEACTGQPLGGFGQQTMLDMLVVLHY